MKIILSKDIPNLGEEGDIKIVANGYARNFLLPNKMVVPFSKRNIKILELNKAVIEKRKEEKRKNALDLKERLEAETITLEMPAGDTGKLFGSVTNAMIAEALDKTGIPVEKKRIEVPEHNIKMIGDYKIKIKLYEHHVANLKITVKKAEQ